MIHRLYRYRVWAFFSGSIFAINGGFLNSVTLISFIHNAVGYITGNLTLSAEYLIQGDWKLFLNLLSLMICFLIGAILTGFTIKKESFKLDYHYSIALLLEGFFIVISLAFLIQHSIHGQYFLAAACGLQNALFTHYGSAIVRTTHMTGTMTDLGILIGQWLKKGQIVGWKLALYLFLILGFFLGSILGALAYSFMNIQSLTFSALLCFLMAGIHKYRQHR